MLPNCIESDNANSVYLTDSPRLFSEGGLTRAGLTPRSVDRFWAKVNRQPDGCWLWTAAVFKRGYGMFNAGRDSTGKQDTRYAHRTAFQLLKGDIPADRELMHSCDVRRCCNPAHLSLGTSGDNVRDALRKGRMHVPHPGAWSFSRDVVAQCLNAPRGTVARLAAEHGIAFQALSQAVRRERVRQQRHTRAA